MAIIECISAIILYLCGLKHKSKPMNSKLILTLLLICVCLPAAAAKVKRPGSRTYIYRYWLRDKQGSNYSLDRPLRFLSAKSIERRQRQGLIVDSTDLPVSRKYVALFRHKLTQVIGTSRWQNTVLVSSTDSLLLEQLSGLPVVRRSQCVFVAPDSLEKTEDIRWTVHEDFNRWDSVKNDPLGMARPQIEMLGGDRLHQAGYRGQGMTIAILDGGFQNYDRIPALQHARITGLRDMVPDVLTTALSTGHGQPKTPAMKIDHGTKVLSALAAHAPEVTMGTAPEATFMLLRCEMPEVEQAVEEDLWTMAAEVADSAGADLINSSLGYYDYDDHRGSYRLQDLDGQTAFISRTAAMLARKGIVHCNSAGNSGMGQWKKIGVPADARDILTVGAITQERRLAAFSSVGPSQDGRVKPDVVAMGAPATLISGRGTLVRDMGTSFSTPIVCGLVACLWQAHPDKTAMDIIDMVRRSADQYTEPTNVCGYGIPDFWKAHNDAQAPDSREDNAIIED